MSRGCFGLLLICGHLAAGVAVAQEIRVRLIDIDTGNPANGLGVRLIVGRGKEIQATPTVPASAVPTTWFPQLGGPADGPSVEGVVRFGTPHPGGLGLQIGEVSMLKVAAIFSPGVEARYVSCADKAVFRTQEVVRDGITVKHLGPWCTNTKALSQVQAAPGDIVMFVRYMTGMPDTEIRVRLTDIGTGKPVKGLRVVLRDFLDKSPDQRVLTSVDGVARFSVPAPSFRDIRDTGPIYVYTDRSSDPPYSSCAGMGWFHTEEVVRQGITVKTLGPECTDTKALHEIKAAPEEIVMFVRHWTWSERLEYWFNDLIGFHP